MGWTKYVLADKSTWLILLASVMMLGLENLTHMCSWCGTENSYCTECVCVCTCEFDCYICKEFQSIAA